MTEEWYRDGKRWIQSVLIFHSCAFFSHVLFCLFCGISGIFQLLVQFWAFLAQILCANFSGSKFCQRNLVRFYHLWSGSSSTLNILYTDFSLLQRPVWQDKWGRNVTKYQPGHQLLSKYQMWIETEFTQISWWWISCSKLTQQYYWLFGNYLMQWLHWGSVWFYRHHLE